MIDDYLFIFYRQTYSGFLCGATAIRPPQPTQDCCRSPTTSINVGLNTRQDDSNKCKFDGEVQFYFGLPMITLNILTNKTKNIHQDKLNDFKLDG